MEAGKYEELRDTIVKPLCEGLLNKYQDLSFSSEWDKKLHEEYEVVRTYVRERMRKNGLPDLRIDRHKVGACVLIAIANVRPLVVPPSNHLPIGARNSNEVVAFKSGIAVVQSWARSDAKKVGNSVALEIANKTFQFPISDDGSYSEHVYRGIRQAQKENKLDPFLWANLLFSLEAFNTLYHQQPK